MNLGSIELRAWAMSMLAGLLAQSSLLMARDLPRSLVPSGVEGIRAASGICRKEDFALTPSEDVPLMPRPALAEAWSPACVLSAPEAQKLLGQRDTILVDVRSSSQFGSFRIPGAINLPAASLRGKHYWRDKQVVLVGSGKAEQALYGECTRLRDGTLPKVRVLQGGMATWLAGGLPVEGRGGNAQSQAALSEMEFWQERYSTPALVVWEKTALPVHPDGQIVPTLGDDDVREVLRRHHRGRKGGAVPPILVVPRRPLDDVEMTRLVQMAYPTPMLVFAGDRDALARHLAIQQAVWKAHADGPAQPGCGL